MSSYKVEFTKSAFKEFKKLNKQTQTKVVEGLKTLAVNPFSHLLKVKKLRGSDCLFRFRVVDYRVVYEIKKNVLKIIVIKVGHRREVYRK